ncbi:unnamed protein product [Gongylonema pulchrum]|uniref:Secreted protein n=1 Tax=Gongylonema pulchrum TaxID=637853 RepID=A0A183E276_9BILA|nr:unnamed protein product [Gongylonema pulchrum]
MFAAFMASAECLVEMDQQPEVKQCHEVTLKQIEEANRASGITVPSRFDKMCTALNYFSSCVERPIERNCGAAAWSAIFRVLGDTTNTLLPGCRFTGHSKPHDLPRPTSGYSPEAKATTMRSADHDFRKYEAEVASEKAQIIWSNDEKTSPAIEEFVASGPRNGEGHGKTAVHGPDPRKNSLSSQSPRRKSNFESRKHVFIDRDTDISYYDNSNDVQEGTGVGSFSAISSANCPHFGVTFVYLVFIVAICTFVQN